MIATLCDACGQPRPSWFFKTSTGRIMRTCRLCRIAARKRKHERELEELAKLEATTRLEMDRWHCKNRAWRDRSMASAGDRT